MSKLITASINLRKVDQSLLIKGEKGTYLSLIIWVNNEPDKYGNDISIEQRVEKGKDKIYVGNGRSYKQSEQPVAPQQINENDDIDEMFK
jgi:hypothetical protein